ncbi:MAG: acyl carrier protein [Phenylobacterium sp.]|uniref:acyl carrier protein n=1 Tax=Phenylobacterium sp. TaxID=1871053 RepID=UPI002724013D|nr:acyl carrier protein [Phenylobacterium sp.]MDO8411744.1 acyl carrier protein [Phenylobacterium sp.]
MQLVKDPTVLEVGKAAEAVLEREVVVTAASDISRDLAVDSLALMNIVMELEDRFDISIPIDRLSEVQTVGDLAALIDNIRNKV